MRRNMWARAVFHHHKSLRIILYANAAVWCILIVDTLLNAAELWGSNDRVSRDTVTVAVTRILQAQFIVSVQVEDHASRLKCRYQLHIVIWIFKNAKNVLCITFILSYAGVYWLFCYCCSYVRIQLTHYYLKLHTTLHFGSLIQTSLCSLIVAVLTWRS